MKSLTRIAITAGLLGLATTALAQPKPEAYVKERQSALSLMGWYFGPLGAVAKGEKPFNKDEAVRATTFLVQLAKMPWEGFAAGTDKVGNTKARPEIWAKQDDFKKKADAMQAEVAKLAQYASAGDEANFKKQVGAVGGSCKACHDDYRAK